MFLFFIIDLQPFALSGSVQKKTLLIARRYALFVHLGSDTGVQKRVFDFVNRVILVHGGFSQNKKIVKIASLSILMVDFPFLVAINEQYV